jgi:hypothetical protein
MLFVFYWQKVLPESLKNSVRRLLNKIKRMVGLSGAKNAEA